MAFEILVGKLKLLLYSSSFFKLKLVLQLSLLLLSPFLHIRQRLTSESVYYKKQLYEIDFIYISGYPDLYGLDARKNLPWEDLRETDSRQGRRPSPYPTPTIVIKRNSMLLQIKALLTSSMTYRCAFKEILEISVLLAFSSFYLMYSYEWGGLSSLMWKLVFDIKLRATGDSSAPQSLTLSCISWKVRACSPLMLFSGFRKVITWISLL